MKLAGKIAVVTGGARHRRRIARCLAAEGAKLALLDVDVSEAERPLRHSVSGDRRCVHCRQAPAEGDREVITRFRAGRLRQQCGRGEGDPNDFRGLGNPFTNITQRLGRAARNNLRPPSPAAGASSSRSAAAGRSSTSPRSPACSPAFYPPMVPPAGVSLSRPWRHLARRTSGSTRSAPVFCGRALGRCSPC